MCLLLVQHFPLLFRETVTKVYAQHFMLIIFYNKKVLLRELKRHTARRVAITPSLVLTGGGGWYPIPGPDPDGGGYPIPGPDPDGGGGEYPIPGPDRGTLSQVQMGGTPSLARVPPHLDLTGVNDFM